MRIEYDNISNELLVRAEHWDVVFCAVGKKRYLADAKLKFIYE